MAFGGLADGDLEKAAGGFGAVEPEGRPQALAREGPRAPAPDQTEGPGGEAEAHSLGKAGGITNQKGSGFNLD